MARLPTISDAEWEVMNVTWAEGQGGEVTAGEVVDRLAKVKEWSPRTIKTLLNRLLKKGALEARQEGKRYLYRAKIGRQECVRQEARSFVDRVFGGASGAMLVHFVSEAKLKPQEIEELRRILARKGRSQ